MGSPQTVGMIGLGRMGLPLAQNLIERGYAVIGHNRSGSTELIASGGELADTPAGLAASSDVIVSILPGPDEVEQVIRGPRGTAESLRPGTVHIEMSTIDLTRKRDLADVVAGRGGVLLDAPISGSPGMVRPRLATPFVSGDAEAVRRVSPVLDALAGPWHEVGAFGAGTHLKYVSGMLMAAHTVAAAEALVFADRLGLDLEVAQQVLDGSIAGSALLTQRGPVMRQRRWTPAPGPVHTLMAILEQVAANVDAHQLPAEVFRAAKDAFDQAVAAGRADQDIACVYDEVGQQADARGQRVMGDAR